VQRFAGVDVPHPRDGAGVHQEILHRLATAPPGPEQRFRIDAVLERLGAEPLQARVAGEPVAAHDLQEPEAAGVGVAQLAAVVERQDHVLVRAARPAGIADPDLPRHPEVDQQGQAGVGVEQQVLAAPADRLDPGAAQPQKPALLDRFAQPEVAHDDPLDATADEERGEPAAYRLDFGELRHAARPDT
jgi:hypothetical protein